MPHQAHIGTPSMPLCAYLLINTPSRSPPATPRTEAIPGSDHDTCSAVSCRTSANPLGTQLSRRSIAELITLGFARARAQPVRLMLEARGVTIATVVTEIA